MLWCNVAFGLKQLILYTARFVIEIIWTQINVCARKIYAGMASDQEISSGLYDEDYLRAIAKAMWFRYNITFGILQFVADKTVLLSMTATGH
jgi:hypothetical protein